MKFKQGLIQIEFEFPIGNIEIDYPIIFIEFENLQDMHHFDRILKEQCNEDKGIHVEFDEKYVIQAPLEYLQGLDLYIQD